ncbi:MAG: 2-dehydro-3-deoxygalactonokinase [Bacteroidota bacterium]
MALEKEWFWSVDWGTSRVRIALVNRPDGSVSKRCDFDLGIWALYQAWQKAGEPSRIAFYLERLFDLFPEKDFPDASAIPIVISGMASASIGLKELPYAQSPFSLTGQNIVSEWIRQDVLLISGLQLGTELMRGEETQCLGLDLALEGAYCFLLPGTHSKHLLVDNQLIQSCQTVMTGEMYAILTKHSILRDSLAGNEAFDEVAFKAGLSQSQKKPLTANLFGIRSADLLKLRSPKSNADYLSGLLIGAECQILPSDKVVLVAGDSLWERYSLAIRSLRPEVKLTCLSEQEAKRLVIEGQRKILNAQITPGLS